MIGKRVRLLNPSQLKFLYPKHRIVKEFPVVDGAYIYVGNLKPDFDRYRNMIWVSMGPSQIDLTDKKTILSLAKFNKAELEYLLSCDEEFCWEVVKRKILFGISPVVEKEESIYKLFTALTKSDGEIYRIYKEIELPQPVVLSSLLTMLEKALNYQQYRGLVNVNYLKTLQSVGRLLKNVEDKFIKFYLSDQTELHFLNLLMELKR